jgi:peroxiredoxin
VIEVDVREAQPRKHTQLLLTILFAFIVAVSLILLLRNNRDSTLAPSGPIQAGLPVPNFTFPDLKGQEVSLSDHAGKVVLVNVWATWCSPCREEMPSMQKLYDRFKGKNFEILAVSVDSTGREAVTPFMQKLNLTFPVLLDPEGNIKPPYGVTGVPESFIVDKEGILVEKIIGPIDWATPRVFRFFRDLIQRPSS